MTRPGTHATAWFLLSIALAVHVADEAAHDFLSVYNPSALAIRERLPWLPVPVFQFGWWLAGLVVAIMGLLALTWGVMAGWPRMTGASYVFGGLMLGYGLAHVVGSLRKGRLMRGVLSSPLLLAAAVFLIAAARGDRSTGRSSSR